MREYSHVSEGLRGVYVGMTKFEKPGTKEWDYPNMALETRTKALRDADILHCSARPASTT